jgi:general stress protein YciG
MSAYDRVSEGKGYEQAGAASQLESDDRRELEEKGPSEPESTVQKAAEPSGEQKPRKPRGFAAMDRKLVSEIAKKGGQAAHRAGTAHEFTSEEARVAGRKGGQATHAKRNAAKQQNEKGQG